MTIIYRDIKSSSLIILTVKTMLQIVAARSSREVLIDFYDAESSKLKTRSVVVNVVSVFQIAESGVLRRIETKASARTVAIFRLTLDIACQNVLATCPRYLAIWKANFLHLPQF